MSYTVITIGREFGCGSGEIARQLAERLGWRLFDRELIDEIARLEHLEPAACTRVDERVDTWLHRVGKGLWTAAGEKGPALIPDSDLDADTMANSTRRVIEAVAAVGQCVVVGRGGNYILRGHPQAFHVFLYAPRSWRVRRLEGQGQTRARAEDLVQTMDHHRATYIRHYFNEEWPRRQLCHMMINASLGSERAAAAIAAAMGNPAPEE